MTRWLDEICECGERKEMYHVPVCFKCEKPKIKTIKVLSLTEAMRYVERKYDFFEGTSSPYVEGPSRKFWLLLCDENVSLSNDATLWIPIEKFLSEPGAWVGEITDPDVILFIEKMIEEFDLNNEDIRWEVSY